MSTLIAHPSSLQPSEPRTSPPPAAAPPSTYLRRFALRSRGRVDFVDLDGVDWIAADRRSVTLIAGGRRLRLHRRVSELERELDPRRFLRIHRSVIVHVAAIVRLEVDAHGGLTLVLRGGERLRVGRQRTAAVRAALLR